MEKNFTKKCTFQILFTSDVHGAFRNHNYTILQESNVSGINKLSTLMKSEKSNFDGKTFIVDIGDIIQGNGTGVLLKKNIDEIQTFPLLTAYNEIGYDIVALGNHEFNFGIDRMVKTFEGFNGDKLCANVWKNTSTTNNDGQRELIDGFKPFVIKTVGDDLKVAFIGVVSPNIMKWDKALMDKSGYCAYNAATVTKEIMDEIRNQADIFILMGHMSEVNELNESGSGACDIVAENKDLTVFLGAHMHSKKGAKDEQLILEESVKFVENVNSAGSYGKVLITATFENGKWNIKNKVGSYEESDVKTDVISLKDIYDEKDVNGNSKKTIIPNDPKIDEITKENHEFLINYMMKTKVGELVGGDLVEEPEIRGTHRTILEPTPYFEFMGQLMAHYAKADFASVAINNYDVNCKKGYIYKCDVARICVYETPFLMKVKMKGKKVKQWLEWSYKFFGKDKNSNAPAVDLAIDLTIPYGNVKMQYLYDQFWGLDYDVDLTKPVGERIKINKLVNGRPFDLEEEYTIATSSYRVSTNLSDESVDKRVFDEPDFKIENITDETGKVIEPEFISIVEDWIMDFNKGVVDCPKIKKPSWRFVNLDWAQERERAIEIIKDKDLRKKLNLDDDFYKKSITIDQIKNI